MSGSNHFFCESYVFAKATHKPILKIQQGEHVTQFGDEIHTNVWGPALLPTKGGRHYYVTFTDDNTWFTHLQLLKTKDETLDAYHNFKSWCDTQLGGAKIKKLRSDRGGEYLGKAFELHLKEKGTKQKLTVHSTP
jgi:hypothetical protein